MTEKDLLKLKDEIEAAKSSVAELRGKHSMLVQELKDTWKCDSVEEANKKLAKLEKEAKKLDEQVSKAMEELEDKYIKVKQ